MKMMVSSRRQETYCSFFNLFTCLFLTETIPNKAQNYLNQKKNGGSSVFLQIFKSWNQLETFFRLCIGTQPFRCTRRGFVGILIIHMKLVCLCLLSKKRNRRTSRITHSHLNQQNTSLNLIIFYRNLASLFTKDFSVSLWAHSALFWTVLNCLNIIKGNITNKLRAKIFF